MTGDLHPTSAIGRDVARMLQLVVRTSKARGLYQSNNEALAAMRKELRVAMNAVFRQVPRVALRVMPDRLLMSDEVVYADAADGDSLPFVLFRDGLRRLEFSEGVDDHEMDALLLAIRRGQQGRTLEDDVVAQLWRHNLQHIRYVAVDVQLTDAAAAQQVESQIDGLLRQLFRRGLGNFNLHLDEEEEAAKAIADGLLRMRSEHPVALQETLPTQPAYAQNLSEPDEGSDLYPRWVAQTLSALEQERENPEASRAFGALLNLFDSSLVSEDVTLATRILEGVRRLPHHGEEVARFMGEALTDARLRQVVQLAENQIDQQDAVYGFFRAAGQRSMPSLVRSLAGVSHPEVRRGLADLVLEVGIQDPAPIDDLVASEQGFAAKEGLYLLAKMGRLNDRRRLREIQKHPRPQVRLALINEIDRVPPDIAPSVLAELLRDDDAPRVRVAAAETLAQRTDPVSVRALEHEVERPEFEEETESVKRAVVLGLLFVQGISALWRLEAFIARADHWRARRSQEELALAAVLGLGQLHHQSAVDLLKKASTSRNRAVRSAARSELERIREGL